MNDNDEILKSMPDFTPFLRAACETVKSIGPTYDFKCPLCGGQAHVLRVPGNGHLHAWCDECDISIDQ